jgi:hypothetical protein
MILYLFSDNFFFFREIDTHFLFISIHYSGSIFCPECDTETKHLHVLPFIILSTLTRQNFFLRLMGITQTCQA